MHYAHASRAGKAFQAEKISKFLHAFRRHASLLVRRREDSSRKKKKWIQKTGSCLGGYFRDPSDMQGWRMEWYVMFVLILVLIT